MIQENAIYPIRRALISVSDKSGLESLAGALAARGVTLISSGGTASYLEGLGFLVTRIEQITNFPEMMDGRVKTLHPAVHGGLLARRDNASHMQSLEAIGSAAIDLVVVNLYPFEATLSKTTDSATLIEQIDIGGPAMIRAAAKNHAFVTVITDIADYQEAVQSLKDTGGFTQQQRAKLAAKAFAKTASYDSAVASYLATVPEDSVDTFPEYLLDSRKAGILSYGENPHQQACVYQRNETTHGIAHAELLGGKPLSYNNLCDADAAWMLVNQFDAPACVIVKHGNPCGVATGADVAEAFTRALACDPQSAFGGVIALNGLLDHRFVSALSKLFVEVIIAPDYVHDALEVLRASKKNLRVLKPAFASCASPIDRWQIKAISGGLLIQTRDDAPISQEQWRCVTKSMPTEAQMQDSIFAMRTVRSVASNAIVLAKDYATIGIGAGQMSRVDAVRIACTQAARHGHSTQGCVLASDAFFPFADNVALAKDAGVSVIVQPGGSVRDEEVIAACNEAGIAMVFTGTRHFKH